MKLIFLVASILLISSCSATGPKFNGLSIQKEDTAVVYFIRPSSRTLSARVINISINGVHFTELRNGGYTTVELAGGTYEFEQSFNYTVGDVKELKSKRKIKIPLKAGEMYFVAFQASSEFGSGNVLSIPLVTQPGLYIPIQMSFNFGFGFINRKTALDILKECRFEAPLHTANKQVKFTPAAKSAAAVGTAATRQPLT